MDLNEELNLNQDSNISYNPNNQLLNEQKTHSQLKDYYKDLKVLVSKRPINPKGKSELSQFKKKIIDLIKQTFKDKYDLFCSIGNEIDLQLFLEYLFQLLQKKISKMVEGYKIFEKMDKNQLLLISKTKSTIISFLISFYDFYEDELVINNEEIVAEIIDNRENLEDSFLITLIKTINLLNMPYITRDEFINMFKQDKKGKIFSFKSKDLGYFFLKIIELFFKIRTLNTNMSNNKKRYSLKNSKNLENNTTNEESRKSSLNKGDIQFSTFLGICFEKIVPCIIEIFSNVILEYDIRNTINIIMKKEELNILFNNFNHVKIIRNKIFNILLNSEKIFNKEQNIYIMNLVNKINLIDNVLSFMNKDIHGNKYNSLRDFLFEIKKVLKYYLVYIPQSENIDTKIISVISLGINTIKSKNIKLIKIHNNSDTIIAFFKDVNKIQNEYPEQKYKIYNFFILIFQSSSLLRKYIYKILLDNFSGDLNNYQEMYSHTKFLSLFIGNLHNCDGEIIDYFFSFLHSFDKFSYFPNLELSNIVSSLTCFTNEKSIQILMNNLEIYNKFNKKEEKIEKNSSRRNSIKENNIFKEQINELFEINKSFLDNFSNIINDIIKFNEDKKATPKNEIKISTNNNNNNINKNITEQRNIFSAKMVIPLLEYISKIIIYDNKIYQYFIEKNFIATLNQFFNINNYKIVAYKFIELLIKSSKNKNMNEERIKVILTRIEAILNNKNENKKFLEEYEKLKELILILKTLDKIISSDVLPEKEILINNKKDIRHLILLGLNNCFDYFKIHKNVINSIFNEKFHNLVKEYLECFFALFISHNKNCINKINENSPSLDEESFELMIKNTFDLYKLIAGNNKIKENKFYLFDIIIYFINKSLNIESTNKTYETDDFSKYYITLLSIDEKILLNESKSRNIYSNIFIYNPLLLSLIATYCIKENIYLENFLNLLYFLLQINKGNIPILFRHNILLHLLEIPIKDNKYNNILSKIFDLCFPLMEKKDLRTIFEYLIKSYNINKLNFTKDILNCLTNSIEKLSFTPKEFGKGIYLSGYHIKQPNIYNIINLTNISFNNYANESIFFVKEEILFYDSIENNKLILFRMDKKTGNKTQFIEISIINGNLTASENMEENVEEINNDKNEMQINAKNFININELNNFVFKFDNSEKILSVIINRKNIFSYPYKFSFNQNILRTRLISDKKKINNINNLLISVGYPLESLINFEDKKFHEFPYIKILSLSISEENPDSNDKKNIINIYEMKINNIVKDSSKSNKNEYSDLTQFRLDKKTLLKCKYNSYEAFLLNNILHRYNIKTQLYNNLIFIQKFLLDSLDYNFRIEKILFILLSSNNMDKEMFKILMKLLSIYVINNNEILSSFVQKEELSSTFYFILLKNVNFITSEIIEIIFSCFLSKKNDAFVINVFLDYKLFDNMELEAQRKALELIINKKLTKGKQDFLELLLNKLTILLLLCDFEEKEEKVDTKQKGIDELIISIIIGILSKNENNMIIYSYVEILLFNLCKFHSVAKEHLEKSNKGRQEDTHYIITNFFNKLYNSVSVIKIKDLLKKYIQNSQNLESNYKRKFIAIINSYKPINLSTNITISFKDSAKSRSLFMRHASVHNPRNFIKNKLDANNQGANNLEKKETHEHIKVLPKIVNEFMGGFKNIRKKTIEIVENEEGQGNNEVISDNDTWVNSEIKNGKLIETEKIICMGNCHLCSFIRTVLDDLFKREIKFNIYENYLLNNLSETFVLNRNLEYKVQFSNYLDGTEGTNRIRNRFKIKVDKISNYEIQEKKKLKKNNNNINIKDKIPNELEKIFGFYKKEEISLNLSNFFNLGQIFDIDYISDCIDKNDTYQYSCNCLLFKGFNYINSVLILGEKQIYILTNMFLDQNLILYNSEKPIKKSFWIIDNYTDMIPDHCQFLQTYDSTNYNINDEINMHKILNKFKKAKSLEEEEQNKSRQIRGFKLIKFSYPRINELHKRRFLHQNNAIEIFLKTGINYYLVFNKDIRDIIVNKILQNISNAINYINESFISNSSNNSVYLNEIINYNSQSIKNENMIFMTDSELFIEKIDQKINLVKNKQKNITKHKKKNNCKILDIKDILDQALDKWTNGMIDTYSYLMILNTLSGRTYNDLAQYPVLPWILSDYSSDSIDLKESNTFRDFSFPIFAQDDESKEILKDKYNSFEDNELKYHSGSHYSNPAFVCYYLIRVKPFSISASEIQGGCFDAPDRLFFDINNFYKISAKYQELIPDFFNLPETYININNFNYGKTLDGIQVTDVMLPSWSMNSPRIFSKMNKKAMESQYVSLQINNWIDLIYGYKQKGIEAEKAYNVLRDVCSNFNPKNYKDKSEIELKINELCEMGIDPIQLFTKPHPKRERHHIIKAFFGRSAYLTYFAPIPTKYPLKNLLPSSKIKEVRKYYEDISGVLSKGEGGLSSFRICYHNNDKYQYKEGNDDIYIIIDEHKRLVPPSYKNFIEWGNNNSFCLVKPLKNIRYRFSINHMKDKIIEYIDMTSSGKYIIIGYNNGVIEKYVLQKIDSSKNFSKINTNSNNNMSLRQTISNDIRISDLSSQNSGLKKIGKTNIFNKLISGFSLSKKNDYDDKENSTIQRTFGRIEQRNFEVLNTISNTNTVMTSRRKMTEMNRNINKTSKIIFDNHISISFSNILNSDCILLNKATKKFLQYNGVSSQIFQDNTNSYDRIPGYNIHSMNQSELKKLSKISSENNTNNQNLTNIRYFIFLVNSSSRIINGISLIEICEPFSFMVIVDKLNKVYLYDFNSFNLLKYIDFSIIFNSKIKSVNICPYTGEFIVASKRNVALMNINGVILAHMDYSYSKINSCFISLIPNSQNDMYLFTGHDDGNLIIFKLKTNDFINDNNEINLDNSNNNNIKSNQKNEQRINCIRNTYIDSYNNDYKKYNDMNNLPFIFDSVIQIKCSQNPLKFIKIKEDLTELICIDNANQIIYLSYKEFFNKNKDKKNLKECPMCKSAISSSKILCYLCGKKLCSKCKIEEIISEYSLKNKKPICEDCLQLMNSTNKLLYDF